MKEIKNVIERYCPEADRNVAVEVKIENGGRVERCLYCEGCRGDDRFCVCRSCPEKKC